MTRLGLRLEVKSEGQWFVLNCRDTRDYGEFPRDLLELLKQRDGWEKLNPGSHMRIVHKERGRPERVIA